MSIAIDNTKCLGCQKCLNVCPGNLLKLADDGKAFIKYPKDCWGCSSCIKECAFKAISLYLGADIGGRGSKLTADIEDDVVHWVVTESNGKIHNIDVNRKDSNKY